MLYVSGFLYLCAIKMSICPLNFKYRSMGNVHYQTHFPSEYWASEGSREFNSGSDLVELQCSPMHLHVGLLGLGAHWKSTGKC